MTKGTARLTTQVRPEDRDRLQRLAESHDRTVAAEIRRALGCYFEVAEGPVWAPPPRTSEIQKKAAEPKEAGGALSSWRIHRLRPGERNQGAGFQAPQPALSCKGNGCTP
jgi:hypothetical protein